MKLIRTPLAALVSRTRSLSARVVALYSVACAAVFGCLLASPLAAMATETETEKKVGEVSSKVGEEGVVIILAILTALIALIVAVTIIPKGVKMIKRFI